MTRRITAVAVTVAALAVPASASALSNGAFVPAAEFGQQKAYETCGAVIHHQEVEMGLTTGGGPKSETPLGPTNCDHLYQVLGVIGQQP